MSQFDTAWLAANADRIATNKANLKTGPKQKATQKSANRKPRKTALPEPTESQMQQSCVRWFRTNPKCKGWLLAGIPNGGYALTGNAGQRAAKSQRLKNEGMIAGFSDLMLDTGDQVYYLEAKKAKGKQSVSQMAFQDRVEKMGREYIIFRSLDEFIEVVEGVIEKGNQ